MTDPTVACIMLTRDRPQMARRAVECFRRQTYGPKVLLIYSAEDFQMKDNRENEWIVRQKPADRPIGNLRNEANAITGGVPDILCHWDDDDWSHPNRIAEQVALLQSSGADAVGYSDLLFWDTRPRLINPELRDMDSFEPANEAWLYSRPTRLNVPGSTLCYWRKTWESKHFPHLPERGNPQSQGEDIAWQAGLKVVAISSVNEFVYLHPDGTFAGVWDQSVEYDDTEPRIIASIHGGNTMAFGYANVGHVEEFKRAAIWDDYCERVMKL